MNIRPLLFLAAAVLLLFGGWKLLNSDTARVRRTLRAAVRTLEKESQESALIGAVAAQQAAAYFTETPILEIRGVREGEITRDEIRYGVAYARAQVSRAEVTLSDLSVAFPEDGRAEAGLTAHLRATAAGETTDWIQEFKVGLTRAAEGRLWHISRVATVDAVQWPGVD